MNRHVIVNQRAALLLCALSLCTFLPSTHGREIRGAQPDSMPLSTEAVLAATTPEAALQETALRQAIANATHGTVNFTLTTDIVLGAPLPILRSIGVSIVGRCKDRSGNPRRCIIDGAGRYSVFIGDFSCDIALERLIVQNVLGSVHRGECSLSARYVVFRNNVAQQGAVLYTIQSSPWNTMNEFFHCDFVNNTARQGGGGAFNVGNNIYLGPTLSFTRCTFQNNRAPTGLGGAINSMGNVMSFRSVVFQGNSAGSGGAIATGATSFTAINTTFSANTAVLDRGGAIMVQGLWANGSYKFCSCTFRNNSVKFKRYSSSNNMVFYSGGRVSVDFCPGPVPGGIHHPKRLSLVHNCTGCSGCEGDCYGRGQCISDPVYGFSSCHCNPFFEDSSSCTGCQQGYTRQSRCRECSYAYYHPVSKPATCNLCPGLSKVLPDTGMINSINNATTAATGPLQCQSFCNATQQPFEGINNPYSRCNMWVYMAQRTGAPAKCARMCFMLSQKKACRVGPLQKVSSYNITYQYLEPDWQLCDDE